MRAGGLIVFDNVLWLGQVVREDDQSESTVAMRRLNDAVVADPRVEAVMISVGDGLLLARKL
jgi:caffeoyl-CoA O-methyltransferase